MEADISKLPGDSHVQPGLGILFRGGHSAAVNAGRESPVAQDFLSGWLTKSLHLNLINGAGV